MAIGFFTQEKVKNTCMYGSTCSMWYRCSYIPGPLAVQEGEKCYKPGKLGYKGTNLQGSLESGVVSAALQSCFVKMIKVQVAT